MRRLTFLGISWFLVWVLALAATMVAQEKPPSSTVSVGEAQKEEEAKKKEEDKKKPAQAPVETSAIDRMYSGLRNNATFAVRFTANYDSNLLGSNVNSQGGSFESISPRFVANVQKKTFGMDVDYSASYLAYNKFSNLNKSDHLAGVAFRFQFSPRTYARIAEHVSYSTNSFATGVNQLLSPTQIFPPANQSLFFRRQRIFRNVMEGKLGYQLTPDSTLNWFGTYDVERYRSEPFNNLSGGVAGVRWEHRMSQRLTVSTEYSFSYFTFNNVLNSSRIHSVGMGFRYLLRPSVAIFASGGIQSANVQRTSKSGGSVVAGITKSTSTNTFSIAYENVNTNQVGLATTVRSQGVSAHFRRRITNKAGFTLDSGYTRNRLIFNQNVPINTYTGGVGFEYAVRSDLTFFANYGYVRQRSPVFILQAPIVSRSTASIGFEFRLPALR